MGPPNCEGPKPNDGGASLGLSSHNPGAQMGGAFSIRKEAETSQQSPAGLQNQEGAATNKKPQQPMLGDDKARKVERDELIWISVRVDAAGNWAFPNMYQRTLQYIFKS